MKFALITFINGGLLTITASYKNTAKLYNLSSNLNPCVIRLIKEIEWRHITKMKRITQEINNKLLTTTLYLKISCQLLKAIILTLITLF